MNYYLLKKEIGGLRLILWLLAAYFCIEVTYSFTTGFPDVLSAEEQAEALDDAPVGMIVNSMIFGMLIGIFLFGQEREHQTIPFLDGLPVRRLTLFLHKLLAACLVSAFVVIALQAFNALFTWLSSDSLSSAMQLQQLAVLCVVHFLLTFAIVGGSTFVSFSRRWFPLIAGLIVWWIVLIRSSDSASSQWIDTAEMLRWSLGESHSVIPWKPMLGHFLLGCCGWLGALVVFHYRDGRISRQIDRMAQWRFANWAIALSQLAAVGVWLNAIFWLSGDVDNDSVESRAAGNVMTLTESDQPPSGLVGFGREESDHYEIVFRESQREAVERTLSWLDPLHEEVRQFFGNPPAPAGKIVLDLSSPVMSHASGQTNWTKIRVPLALAKDDYDFCSTVRHETAHVYIEQLSGGVARDEFNAMRMFHEGVASLAEFADDLQAGSAPRLLKERWACGVDSRGRVPFHVLCDDEKLTTLRDPDVVYPLGFIVAEALIDAGGPTLPRRFLETLRGTPLPPGIKAAEVWRIILQKCGSSLDRVIAEYETRLDALAERERTFLDGLPKLTADVSVMGDQIVVRVNEATSPDEFKIAVCMIERDRLLTKLPERIPRSAPGEFRIARSSVTGNKIRVLVGWATRQSEGIIYEPWQSFELKE